MIIRGKLAIHGVDQRAGKRSYTSVSSSFRRFIFRPSVEKNHLSVLFAGAMGICVNGTRERFAERVRVRDGICATDSEANCG